MKRALAIIGLAVMLCTFPGTSPGQEKKQPAVVAVFMIENRGSPLTTDELLALTDYLGTKLGERGHFQIIPRDEIRKRLTEQKSDSFKACYDQSCQIEIGRELAAGLTVSSSISKVGSTCIVTAALYDLQKAATANTATAKGLCTADALLIAMEQIADKLEGKTEPEPPKVVTQPVREIREDVPMMPPRQPRTKSTVVACLAALLPGGGMFYLERWGWGLFYVGAVVGGMAMFIVSITEENTALTAIGGATYGIGYLISWIHTYSAAEGWRDPDFDYGSGRQSRGQLPPAIIVPVFSGRF